MAVLQKADIKTLDGITAELFTELLPQASSMVSALLGYNIELEQSSAICTVAGATKKIILPTSHQRGVIEITNVRTKAVLKDDEYTALSRGVILIHNTIPFEKYEVKYKVGWDETDAPTELKGIVANLIFYLSRKEGRYDVISEGNDDFNTVVQRNIPSGLLQRIRLFSLVEPTIRA